MKVDDRCTKVDVESKRRGFRMKSLIILAISELLLITVLTDAASIHLREKRHHHDHNDFHDPRDHHGIGPVDPGFDGTRGHHPPPPKPIFGSQAESQAAAESHGFGGLGGGHAGAEGHGHAEGGQAFGHSGSNAQSNGFGGPGSNAFSNSESSAGANGGLAKSTSESKSESFAGGNGSFSSSSSSSSSSASSGGGNFYPGQFHG